MNSIGRDAARPNRRKLTAVPKSPIAIMGFLPYLSESIPHKGEKRSCAKAKEAAKNPIETSDALKVLAYRGSKGNIIENATILMNTVTYIKNNDDW